MKLTIDDLEKRYEQMTTSIVCECELATQLAGGLPADEDGIRNFVRYQLKIPNESAATKSAKVNSEFESAVQRILAEEVGQKPVPSAEGELEERMTYGINVIRRTARGVYLGNWMIHACLKQATSRLKIFTEYRGSKGNFAEAGRVLAAGSSRLDADSPGRVYLLAPDGSPAATRFEEFKGRVQSPKGSVSVIHHSECVPPGTLFTFEFRFILGTLTDNDIADILALAMNVGLGSVKALGCGKFRILSADINDAKKARGGSSERNK